MGNEQEVMSKEYSLVPGSWFLVPKLLILHGLERTGPLGDLIDRAVTGNE